MNNDETAERIITMEGLTFALATRVGGRDDIKEARQMLKEAIVRALTEKETVTK